MRKPDRLSEVLRGEHQAETNGHEIPVNTSLVGEPSTDELERIVDVLNDDQWALLLEPSGMASELRRLIVLWQESGPNTRKLFNAQAELLHEAFEKLYFHPIFTKTGRAHIAMSEAGEIAPTAKGRALQMFMSLILNPCWDRLGGPCARCGRYYLKKTIRQKVYCSRSCGSLATARKSTLRGRAVEHNDKLRRAVEAMRQWSTARTKLDWKQWVSIKEPGISQKFLTRAVNKGELKAPAKARK